MDLPVSGLRLKWAELIFFVGRFDGWSPISAEATSGGYEVAWKLTGSDQYTVWKTDAGGNYLSNLVAVGPGATVGLEALEPGFHQDLNGDGVIGLQSTIVESNGSTSLTQVGVNFYLGSAGVGPSLKMGGTDFFVGRFDGWSPISVEATSGGYEVAWKLTGSDQYTVWKTDAGGNYLSNLVAVGPGATVGLEALEPGFHQDLNGDGVIGSPQASLATALINNATLAQGTLGHDALIFEANPGPTTVIDSHTSEDIVQYDHTSSADAAAIVAHMADDAMVNSTIITYGGSDTASVESATSAILQQHLGDFHIV